MLGGQAVVKMAPMGLGSPGEGGEEEAPEDDEVEPSARYEVLRQFRVPLNWYIDPEHRDMWLFL